MADSQPLAKSITLKQSTASKQAGPRAKPPSENKQYSDLFDSMKLKASGVSSKPFGYTQKLSQIPEFAFQALPAR